MKSEIDNAANGYLHKWDVNGVPTTSFTWDDMVECFKYAVEWKGKQMEKEQQEAPAELEEAAAAAMPKPNGIDSKADFSFFQMLNMFKAGAEWDRAKMMEQPEVDTLVILPEDRMVSYIKYCLERDDDECNCPSCDKHITGLRLFPYFYDKANNDVYFATICPECNNIIISKE